MSATPEYIPEKYITTSDVFDHIGIPEEKQKTISAEEKHRYQGWVRDANNRVETELFPDSDNIPLNVGDNVYTYAKSAALDWVVYKKRDQVGSKNAINAKNDYDRNIKLAKHYLKMTPTKKNEPIQTPVTSDSLEDFIIPYSQSLGYPTDLLY
jgi:hypothetical protein